MSFKIVNKFEKEIAKFFGAPYAVAVDSCTHGIELCIRYQNLSYINVPTRTYISIPFLAKKLGLQLREQNINTVGYHYYMTPEIAQQGLNKLSDAIKTTPKQWIVTDWPDLTKMDVFK